MHEPWGVGSAPMDCGWWLVQQVWLRVRERGSGGLPERLARTSAWPGLHCTCIDDGTQPQLARLPLSRGILCTPDARGRSRADGHSPGRLRSPHPPGSGSGGLRRPSLLSAGGRQLARLPLSRGIPCTTEPCGRSRADGHRRSRGWCDPAVRAGHRVKLLRYADGGSVEHDRTAAHRVPRLDLVSRGAAAGTLVRRGQRPGGLRSAHPPGSGSLRRPSLLSAGGRQLPI